MVLILKRAVVQEATLIPDRRSGISAERAEIMTTQMSGIPRTKTSIAELLEAVRCHALLVTRDDKTRDLMTRLLKIDHIQVNLCSELPTAAKHVCKLKLDAVIVDLATGPDSLGLVSKIRGTTSNRGAVVCAICDCDADVRAAFRAGATCALRRPLTHSSALRMLRAIYPFLLQERRRYFRCPIQCTCICIGADGRKCTGTAINLSDQGMCIESPDVLGIGETAQIIFTLPGALQQVMVQGEACWSRSGRLGITFAGDSRACAPIHEWLSREFEEAINYSAQCNLEDHGRPHSPISTSPHLIDKERDVQPI